MAREYNYRQFKGSVAYVEVEDAHGHLNIGTAFHVGDGVFVTAKHVVEGKVVRKLATTLPYRWAIEVDPTRGVDEWGTLGPIGGVPQAPFFSDDGSDVALLVLPAAAALPALKLGTYPRERLEEMVLDRATVMGFPRVPMARDPPVLLALNAEINAIIEKYSGQNHHLILSTMARGGFSGGPVIQQSLDATVLGLVTESLGENHAPAELGFMAVLTVEPIYRCLELHDLLPAAQTT